MISWSSFSYPALWRWQPAVRQHRGKIPIGRWVACFELCLFRADFLRKYRTDDQPARGECQRVVADAGNFAVGGGWQNSRLWVRGAVGEIQLDRIAAVRHWHGFARRGWPDRRLDRTQCWAPDGGCLFRRSRHDLDYNVN